MAKRNIIILDTEADGLVLQANFLWTVCLLNSATGEKLKVNPYIDKTARDKVVEFVFRDTQLPPIVTAHYGLGYDMFILSEFLGIPFTVGDPVSEKSDTFDGKDVCFIDTFYLSMFLNPDRERHSIEYFGELIGSSKIDWRAKAIELGLIENNSPKGEEFKRHHPEMDVYCEQDVNVCSATLTFLLQEWQEVYGYKFTLDNATNKALCAFRCGQKSFFLMSCQELTGFKFDIELAHKLVAQIEGMMDELRIDVEKQLPLRGLKKTEESFYRMPAKPYKADNTLSSAWSKWADKHNGKHIIDDVWEFYGEKYTIEPKKLLNVKLPMEISNQDQIKDWLLNNGWKPTFFNYKRGPDGKPMRDPKTRKLIETTPKLQEAQVICPNLMKMEGELIQKIVKWLSLRNRLSVLTGWLGNERLQIDGRLGAARTGIAATHRQKHAVICNIPKASDKVLLGKEFRSLFTSEDGMMLAAGDAAALEGRVQGEYCWKFDDGETARVLLQGDPHSATAKRVFAKELEEFDITSPDFKKDDPKFKPYRDRSKNIFYSILYGAGDAKVAKVAGVPEKRGKQVSEAFWEANAPTKMLKDAVEAYWETKGKSTFLPAKDNRMLCTRKRSALLNTLFQSAGAIAMDYACCFMDMWLGELHYKDRKPFYLYKGYVVRRVAYVHDEVEFECDEAIAHEVATMIENAIHEAGKFLGWNVELKGEGQVGKNWKDVH